MRILLVALIALVPACTPRPPDESGPLFPVPVNSETPSPTPSAVQLMPAQSADKAAAMLLAAWRAGDRAAAERVARPAAVEALFAHRPAPTQSRGCSQVSSVHACAFRYGNRLLRVEVSTYESGWVVDRVEVR